MRKVKSLTWLVGLPIIIGSHLYLLSRLIFFPYPELFIYSYLTKQGLLPYKQILDQHFPGVMFFPINLATLGIDTPQEARLLHLAVVAITQVILFIVARKLFNSDFRALIVNFLYLLWQPFYEGYVLWIDTFVPIFLLIAFYCLIEHKAKPNKLFLSGLFLGIALIFKQTVVPIFILLTIYLFLYTKKQSFYNSVQENPTLKGGDELNSDMSSYLGKPRLLRRGGCHKVFLGFSIPVIILGVYILLIGVGYDFIYWTFIFNITTFAEMGRKYPNFADILKTVPLFGSSVFLLIYFYYIKAFKNVALVAIFFVGSLAFAYARFDLIHLQPALPFAILLVVILLNHFKYYGKLFLFAFIVFSIITPISFIKSHSGKKILFFTDFEKQTVVEVKKYAKPGDSIFAMGTFHHVYQMTDPLPPGRVFVFQFPWFMVEAQDIIYKGIISDPPKVVIRDKNASVDNMNLVSYMPNINNYVDKYYRIVNTIEGAEILIRK